MNKTLGYETPADVVYKYRRVYWKNVAPQIDMAIRYLNVTSSGRQWIANLHSNVFRAEREMNLSGPQPYREAVVGLAAGNTGDTQSLDEAFDEAWVIAEEELLSRRRDIVASACAAAVRRPPFLPAPDPREVRATLPVTQTPDR